jgi:DeoR/GlpR family transcriptional regulator of sugar metabolism
VLIVERRQRILDAARSRGTVSARELSASLGISEVTIRRDIRQMAEEGHLRRTRGGAMVAPALAHEPSSHEKALEAGQEKAAIAVVAAGMVANGESIILGPGTTMLALARELVDRRDLTVVTNSLLVPPALGAAPGVELLLVGGTVRPSIDAVLGPATERALRSLRAGIAFVSGSGFSAERGLTTPNLLVAATDQAIVEAAARVVVLADRTKIGREAMFQTIPAQRVDILLTDDGADAEELERLRDVGVEVRVAATTRADRHEGAA